MGHMLTGSGKTLGPTLAPKIKPACLPTSSRPITRPSRLKQPSHTTVRTLFTRKVADPTSPGLFGITGLKRPEDFMTLAQQAVYACEDIKRRLGSMSRGPEAVGGLDAISNQLCLVIDAAELARNAHEHEDWREGAEAAFGALAGYIHELNTDPCLYKALTHTLQDKHAMESLGEEGRRVAMLLQHEFEASGVHLPPQDRDEVRALLNEVTELETAYAQNLVQLPGTIQVDGPLFRSQVPLSLLSPSQHQSLQSQSQANSKGPLTLTADTRTLDIILRCARDGGLRRSVYEQAHGRPNATPNINTLHQLIQARHALSTRLGYASYGHRYLSDKLLKTPQAVQDLLTQLAHTIQWKVCEEVEVLRAARFHREKIDGPLQQWDVSHYMGVVRGQRHPKASEGAGLAPYLSLTAVVQGMALLTQQLFGLQLTPLPMGEDESWCDSKDARIQKLGVVDGESGLLGVMYLDLYARPHKYSHQAQFTVRCGCQPWGSRAYQTPVVALVCNFTPTSTDRTGRDVVLLSHGEVESLFHEFGHVLHALLARTQYQHVSGTRGAVDYVETPSHLLEYFTWDHRFMRQWARHYVTGEELPLELLQAHRSSKQEFAGLEAATQVLYASVDQRLFGPQSSPIDPGSDAFLQGMHSQVMPPSLAHARECYWPARFGHVTTYGAGYYTYLLDKAFASHIWHQVFAPDPLSQEAGHKLWHKMLRYGGGRDPSVLLGDVLDGQEPSLTPYLTELGVAPTQDT